jgi:hypothetical protein
MVKIYLRSVQRDLGRGVENCLYMRDSNGSEGINDLETTVRGGSGVSWELEKNSGIKSITRVWVTDSTPHGKVFKNEPKKGIITRVFQAEMVSSDKELEDKYNIRYITDKGEEYTVDPFIRIPPPK